MSAYEYGFGVVGPAYDTFAITYDAVTGEAIIRAVRDVRFGRLALPTIYAEVAEAVGDQLEAVGGGVVPGERRARPLNLNLPLHGSEQEVDPFIAGERMRRQMRALMENTKAKLTGLYFRFAADPELNAWLLVGAGDLGYGDGGLALADFRLQLQDCYKVASLRTHRPARRVELYDRRLSTTARDLAGTLFSVDFAGVTAQAVTYLPVGVYDVTGYGKRVVAYATRASLGGGVPVVVGAQHAEVLSFEWDETAIHSSDDVIVYDRQGGAATTPPPWAIRIAQTAPVVFLRFSEPTGAIVAADASDNGLDGVYIGAQQPIASGAVGQAVGLNAEEGIFVRVPDSPLLRIVGDLSIEGWVVPLVGVVNLVSNYSFESGDATPTWPWATVTDATHTLVTFAQQAGWRETGTSSLRWTVTSGATAGNDSKINGLGGMDGRRVLPNTDYYVAAVVNAQDPAGNVLANPGFEADASAWTPSAPTTSLARSTVRAHSGVASGRMGYAGSGFGYIASPGGDTGGMRNGMVAGGTYTFSVWVYVPSGIGLNANTVFLAIYDFASGAYAQSNSAVATLYDTWQQLTVTRTIRAGATEAFCRVAVNQGDLTTFELYVDDAQLTDTAGGGISMFVPWYTSAGVLISVSATTPNAMTGRQIIGGAITSPANAAFARVGLLAHLGANETSDYYVDAVELVPGTAYVAVDQLRPSFDTIASKWRSTTGKRAYRFVYDPHLSVLRFDLSVDGAARSIAEFPVALAAGSWYQVGVSYLAASGTATFFINGQPLGSVSGLPTSIFAGTAQLTVGKAESDA